MKKGVLSLAGLLMVASVPAMAVTAQSGFYVGGSMGAGNHDIYSDSSTDNSLNVQFSSNNFAFSGMAGYNYALTAHWLMGLEFGYDQLNTTSYNVPGTGNTDLKSRDYDALLTGMYQFTSGWNLFAKAGMARLSQHASSPVASDDLVRYRPTVKFGGGYLFELGNAGSVNVFVQASQVFADNDHNNDVDLVHNPISFTTGQVGVVYNIPM